MNRTLPFSATGTDYDVPDVTTVTSNGAAVRKRLRLPLIAALALAFVSLSLISGIAYIVVLAGATNTAEKLMVDRNARVVEQGDDVGKCRVDGGNSRLGIGDGPREPIVGPGEVSK